MEIRMRKLVEFISKTHLTVPEPLQSYEQKAFLRVEANPPEAKELRRLTGNTTNPSTKKSAPIAKARRNLA